MALAYRQLPSCCLLTRSVCMHVNPWCPSIQISSSYKDTIHTGLGPTLRDSFYIITSLNTYFRIQSQSEILKIKASKYEGLRHRRTEFSSYQNTFLCPLLIIQLKQYLIWLSSLNYFIINAPPHELSNYFTILAEMHTNDYFHKTLISYS